LTEKVARLEAEVDHPWPSRYLQQLSSP
jgi:hypothetical protein